MGAFSCIAFRGLYRGLRRLAGGVRLGSKPATCCASPRWPRLIELLADGGPDAYYRGRGRRRDRRGGPGGAAGSWWPPTSPRTRGSGSTRLRGDTATSRSPSCRRRRRGSRCSRSCASSTASTSPRWTRRRARHLIIEAVKLGLVDRDDHVTDPAHVPIAPETLLGRRLDRQSPRARSTRAGARAPTAGRTPARRHRVPLRRGRRRAARQPHPVELPRASGPGCTCRSGASTSTTGARRSRSTRPAVNALAPSKRPMHTLIPAMVLRDGRPSARVRVDGWRRAGPGARAAAHPDRRRRRRARRGDRRAPLAGRPGFDWKLRVESRFDPAGARRARGTGHEIIETARRTTRHGPRARDRPMPGGGYHAAADPRAEGAAWAADDPPPTGPAHGPGAPPGTIGGWMVNSVDEVRDALERARLPPRRGPRDVDLPGALVAAAAAPRGRGRRRQDRGRQGARPLDRRRAGPAAVLRGHRRIAGRLRVGLLPPAPAPPGGRGERRPGRRGRAVLGAVPRAPAAAAGDRPRRRSRRRCCSSTRSTGPTTSSRRSSSRSSPTTRSRSPSSASCEASTPPVVILTSNRTRDVHDALKRRCLYHWIDHPDFERELAIVRLQGAARSAKSSRAGRRRPSRCCATSSCTSRPGSPRRSTGRSALAAPRSQPHLDEHAVVATLGTILKYREDQDRVREHGVAEIVTGRGADGERAARAHPAHVRPRRSDGCCRRSPAGRVRPHAARGRSRRPGRCDRARSRRVSRRSAWSGQSRSTGPARATLVRRPEDVASLRPAFACVLARRVAGRRIGPGARADHGDARVRRPGRRPNATRGGTRATTLPCSRCARARPRCCATATSRPTPPPSTTRPGG